jgi:hypothetical protein
MSVDICPTLILPMEVEHAVTNVPINAIQIQRLRHEYAKSSLSDWLF